MNNSNLNRRNALVSKKIVVDAVVQSFKKLNPKMQVKNPVMFVVFLGAVITTVFFCCSFLPVWNKAEGTSGYIFAISMILWFTVLFANFAESLAEGRGRAQAESLKKSRQNVRAKKITQLNEGNPLVSAFEITDAEKLVPGDIILVQAGEQIAMDGEVIIGVASVDESAITGESALVIRESGGDRSAVTGGTTVTSDWLVVKVTAQAGSSFLDKMISMVEGANRKKTPNEVALEIFLITLTVIFVVVCGSLLPFSKYISKVMNLGQPVSFTNAIALLVCLAPTTIGALLSSIGIAGMARLNKANVLAMSGRAIEAAGDVDILLLDKTGTITLGNRQAAAFLPVSGVSEKELAEAAQLSSLSDETAEGRSIVILAKQKFNIRTEKIHLLEKCEFIPFSAKTRMSGVNLAGAQIRKGAADAIKKWVEEEKGAWPSECTSIVNKVAQEGGTPLVVAQNGTVLGVVYLKDIIKNGIKEKFQDLRKMGIKTVMITGDNPVTAQAIAQEAGVDEFVAEATPETKLELIKKYQAEGHLVAMTGDGTNDAPALAQADVAVAMNSGTQAAKEAGNMVDLDSSPAKLIEIVRIGKQLLMTRGSLTTFSIANDIAKYFAIIPVLFYAIFPGLNALNFMRLNNSATAILASVIYNALIIIALIPISLKGVRYSEESASKLLSRNLLVYGLGGVVAPFVFIKLFDMILGAFGVC